MKAVNRLGVIHDCHGIHTGHLLHRSSPNLYSSRSLRTRITGRSREYPNTESGSRFSSRRRRDWTPIDLPNRALQGFQQTVYCLGETIDVAQLASICHCSALGLDRHGGGLDVARTRFSSEVRGPRINFGGRLSRTRLPFRINKAGLTLRGNGRGAATVTSPTKRVASRNSHVILRSDTIGTDSPMLHRAIIHRRTSSAIVNRFAALAIKIYFWKCHQLNFEKHAIGSAITALKCASVLCRALCLNRLKWAARLRESWLRGVERSVPRTWPRGSDWRVCDCGEIEIVRLERSEFRQISSTSRTDNDDPDYAALDWTSFRYTEKKIFKDLSVEGTGWFRGNAISSI